MIQYEKILLDYHELLFLLFDVYSPFVFSVFKVGLWLIRMDMESYSQMFQNRNIDGQELLNLNGARLKVANCCFYHLCTQAVT